MATDNNATSWRRLTDNSTSVALATLEHARQSLRAAHIDVTTDGLDAVGARRLAADLLKAADELDRL